MNEYEAREIIKNWHVGQSEMSLVQATSFLEGIEAERKKSIMFFRALKYYAKLGLFDPQDMILSEYFSSKEGDEEGK